ncbi:MAG: YeeE/YedE family protein [Alphaproteobacteria bacterium]
MKTAVTALLAGILFGAGLALSGMMNPAKVIGFLDITGNWDPSLAFVMGGALAVMAVGYQIARRRQRPALDESFHYPTSTAVDRRLVAGAALFGVGWGISGLCPGPALAGLMTGTPEILTFVGAMAVGMVLSRLVVR